ncbi:MAG: hypothetical protein NDI91_05275 [Sulfuritalea sp.]|nr:hypothetical protein [Sulfuritalea sp.]
MAATATQPSVKIIDANGRISLGKQFAGRQVLVEEKEPGIWLVRTATVVPDNERWLHEAQSAAQFQERSPGRKAIRRPTAKPLPCWRIFVAKAEIEPTNHDATYGRKQVPSSTVSRDIGERDFLRWRRE